MPWFKGCFCGKTKKKKKRPEISGPLHLLLKPDSDSQNHAFRSKLFKKPRPCNLCHQPIHHQGSVCRVCKFVCHKTCENKAVVEAKVYPEKAPESQPRPSKSSPSRYLDTSWVIHRQWMKDGIKTFPTVASHLSSTPSTPVEPTPSSTPIQRTPSSTPIQRTPSLTPIQLSPPSTPIQPTPPVTPSTPTQSSQVHTNDGSSRPISKPKQTMLTTSVSSRKSSRGREQSMDLSYVTERIIALWFPPEISAAGFRQGQQQAAHMLHSKHGNSYMVFNLSEPRRAVRSQHERVRELGWPHDLAPPLERLCSVCKDIDFWLSGDSHRIAVLHAKGNRERIGVVVAAYLHYSNICCNADQALDRFSMKKYLDDKIGDLDQPSHRRYLDYFSGLLSRNIRINAAPLYLTHVTVLGSPSFDDTEGGGCRAFLKIYEGLVPVYTSGIHTVSGDTKQFTVNVAGERRRGLQLRGDILIKCYHRHYSSDSSAGTSPTRSCSPQDSAPGEGLPPRELIFACQFHTCAVSDYTLSFTRQELDSAWNDLRFPLDGAVELHFSANPEGVRFPTPAPTPAVPVDMSPDPVTRWDSYDHLPPDTDTEDNEAEVSHTYGPLDGSLYATVRTKKQEVEVEAGPSNSSPGAGVGGGTTVISSVHTVSMDSGISSAGNGLLTQPTPSYPDHHRALDELLNDMLLTVENIPDLKLDLGSPHSAQRDRAQSSVDARPSRGSEPDQDIPYHARQDSRPFTYGSVPAGDTMLRAQAGLSSPSLVRKASFKSDSPRNGTISPPPRDIRRSTSSHSVPTARSPDFHEGSVVSGSISQHNSNNLTWLQRQQQKLRERREVQLRSERHPHETRLLSELRTVQTSSYRNLRPSQRLDGYTSDTTLFADEDEGDFTIPLHINTTANSHKATNGSSAPVSPLLPHRTSSRRNYSTSSSTQHQFNTISNSNTLGRQKSDSSFDRERPFVAVKRSHEQNRKYSENSLRDESYSSWRTTSTSEETGGSPPHSNSPRPQTPAFPVHPRTPYVNSSSNQFDSPAVGLPPKSPTAQRKEWSPITETLVREQREHSTSSTLRGYESDTQYSPKSPLFSGIQNGNVNGGQSSPSVYYGQSRRSSIHSNSEPPQDVSPAHVKFVRDTSRFWYKPTISREEAIAMLRDKQPGTFVVRDSNSFPNAFGLALKVATPPPSTPVKSSSADPSSELVRHFLIEPTSRGVKLKGCANEPVFSSLSALVYQHSLMPLALPCRLSLPEIDPSRQMTDGTNTISTAQLLLAQGAACNVLYLLTVDTESLTGPQAIVRAVTELFTKAVLPSAAIVHFKVSGQGITLTDNKRQLFFRRHYPVSTISYCGLDPDDHRWTQRSETGMPISSNRCFGFVARKPASKTDNQCHIFAELEPEQPATAIVNFVSKVMMNSGLGKSNIV